MKLIDELGTKYVVDQWYSRLSNILSNCTDLDIAEARFSHNCAELIESAQKHGTHIFDSADPERQELLDYNVNIYNNVIETVSLPKYESIDIVDYIQSLKEDVVYTPYDDSDISLALAFLILVARPSINLDITYITYKLFTNIHLSIYANYLQEIVDSTDEFLVQVNVKLPKTKDNNTNGLFKVKITEKDINTPFYIYGIGNITWLQLVTGAHRFAPSYLGTKKLVEDESWSYLVEESIELLDKHQEQKNKSLYNLLKEIANG